MKITPDKIRVAVFDDSLFFLEAISDIVKSDEGLVLCGSFTGADNVIHDIKLSLPDVVMMDIDMPGTNGIDALRILRKHFPELLVIMLTQHDDDDNVIAAICSGANGYKLKTASPDRIIKSIYDVFNGNTPLSPSIAKKILFLFSRQFSPPITQEYPLSPREKDVLNEVIKGHSYKVIANNLGITYDTVRAHIKQIYKKLQVNTISGAVAKALHGNKQNIS